MRLVILSWGLLLISLPAFAADLNAIQGVWTVASGDARVEISRDSSGVVDGKIVYLREPTYPVGDAEAGLTKHDRENPDPARHSDSTLGLALLKGFHLDKPGYWSGGTIYDPKIGKTYSCKLRLTDDNHLDVRGFIGISLIGRTETWTRFVELH
jgi:uncharacterized protein (DUF2147 family)